VRSDTCVAADGTLLDPYHVIELPNWVNTLAFTSGGDIVLVREYRHGTGTIMLELPSGTVEPGEDALAAARRELLEETGYGGGVWHQTASCPVNPARQNNWVSTFVAIGVTAQAPPRPEPGEVIEVLRMAPSALFAGLADRTLRFQGQHMAALFGYLLPLLARRPAFGDAAMAEWLSATARSSDKV
jgi:8-oxo-dGTP pyrophosphatase MutT (NUDIX family)